MNIRHCKICGEAEFGPMHILERELNSFINERENAERKGELTIASYFFDAEQKTRTELFNRAKFSSTGFHEFEAEDNLDMVERLAKERGLV